MLSLNLDYIFKVRGIEKPFTFLTRAGFTHYTASSLMTKKVKNIKLKHLELLCSALLCEPNDLFKWTPNTNNVYPENFPLKNLINEDTDSNWKKKIDKMSFKELKAFSESMKGKEEERD